MAGPDENHPTRSAESAGFGTGSIYQVNAAPGFGENPELDRFFITVPLILGSLPEVGAMTFQERYELAKTMRESLDDSQSIDLIPNGLVVRPGENVHIGFRYTAPDGSGKWATATTKVVTHPAFDLMSVDHRETMSAAYVGEDLNLRVVDPGADLTDAADTVKVLVQAKSGAKHTVELHESGTHTGIFKGSYQLAYAGATSARRHRARGLRCPCQRLSRDLRRYRCRPLHRCERDQNRHPHGIHQQGSGRHHRAVLENIRRPRDRHAHPVFARRGLSGSRQAPPQAR